MNISVIGTGYVGLVTGACLASLALNVICCDVDSEKITNLKNGILTIYEPGLSELVNAGISKGKLHFTTDMNEAISFSDILFITVNTPTLADNSCDLTHISQVATEIARQMNQDKIIVQKSTVPVGTARKIRDLIAEVLKENGKNLNFDLVSNPEFLREGSAINDFMNPDRIVIGTNSAKAKSVLKEIYASQIEQGIPAIVCDTETAEMIKYASNAFLAVKVSFINEIANICELCGADAIIVSKGIGLDKRIGSQFLEPGPGFGGSCFPKDVKALSGLASELDYEALLINNIMEVNRRQKNRMVEKIESAAGPMESRTITVLGLSFKADTDDIRDSPAISIIEGLLEKKAKIKVYDPKAMDNMKKQNPQLPVTYCSDAYKACEDSDCIVLTVGWTELSCLDFDELAKIVHNPVFLDLRNNYDPSFVKSHGFYYEGVGRQ